jgi:hypothetical protein
MSAEIPTGPRPVVPRPVSLAALGLCLVLGSVGAVFVPSLLPLWIVLGGIVGGVVYVVAAERAEDESPRPRRAIGRLAVRAGAATTAVCLALTGVGSILGAAGAPVIILVLGGLGLWAWRARSHRPGGSVVDGGPDGRRAVSPPPVPEVRPDTAALTTHELCRAWQRSYFALIDVPEGPVREEIAMWRRSVLDELERRDSAGFDEWLRNGARAGSDPSRYLDLTTDH